MLPALSELPSPDGKEGDFRVGREALYLSACRGRDGDLYAVFKGIARDFSIPVRNDHQAQVVRIPEGVLSDAGDSGRQDDLPGGGVRKRLCLDGGERCREHQTVILRVMVQIGLKLTALGIAVAVITIKLPLFVTMAPMPLFRRLP